MSKKNKDKYHDMIEKNKKIRKHRFCTGLIMGILLGSMIGYCVVRHFSKDKKKRVEERKFYRARLSEIKEALYQIKVRFHLDDDALDSVNEVDDLITQEISYT